MSWPRARTHEHRVWTCARFVLMLALPQCKFALASWQALFQSAPRSQECSQSSHCAVHVSLMQHKLEVTDHSMLQESTFVHSLKLESLHNSSLQHMDVSRKFQLRKQLPEEHHAVLAEVASTEQARIATKAHEDQNRSISQYGLYYGLATMVEGVSYSSALVTQFSELVSFFSTDEFNWPTHIFGAPRDRHPSGMWGIHDEVDWTVLALSTIFLIVLDFYVVRPWFQSTTCKGLHRTLPVLVFWVAAGLVFNGYIGLRHGTHDAVRWFNGYLLEWLLSMDNIFVFHLVFKLYKTPEHLLSKALFWGVFGAILFRMVFFVALNSLLHFVHWFYYVFGAFLVYSGFQAAHDGDDEDDFADSWVVRSLRWLLDGFLMPAPHYDMEGRLVIWAKDKDTQARTVQISMLVPVIICLELTDILFAVDSVSAKVGQIPDQFVAYSSSVFAMFGLRALFFIIEELVHRLRFLKYGLCFILIFIGAELMLANVVQLPATVVCVVLVSVFTFCVGLSVLLEKTGEQTAEHCSAQVEESGEQC